MLSGRLLGLGLPMTMLLGAVVAMLIVPDLEWWQAGLIGVILAPTDAALGQAVVANPRVPAVVRNALNVESGLNDGLALPFVTILLAVGEVAGGVESESRALETLVFVLAASIAVGIAAGLGGGWIIRTAADRGTPARARAWPSPPSPSWRSPSPTALRPADSSRSGSQASARAH